MLLSSQAEMEVVRQIKERTCFVLFNPQREDSHTLDKASSAGGLPYKLPDGSQILVRSNAVGTEPRTFSSEKMLSAAYALHRSEMNVAVRQKSCLIQFLWALSILVNKQLNLPVVSRCVYCCSHTHCELRRS